MTLQGLIEDRANELKYDKKDSHFKVGDREIVTYKNSLNESMEISYTLEDDVNKAKCRISFFTGLIKTHTPFFDLFDNEQYIDNNNALTRFRKCIR